MTSSAACAAPLTVAATNPLTISVSPSPTATLTSSDADNKICAGEPVTFTASAVSGGSYQFFVDGNPTGAASGNNTFITSTLANGQAVTVRVTANGCAVTSNGISTEVNPIPATPTASNSGPVCAGSNLQLTISAVAGATYLWTGPNNFSSSDRNPLVSNVTSAAAGTYTVTATVNGCPSTAQTTVNVTPAPSATFTYAANTYCSTDASPTPTVIGTAGGSFAASPAGLSINPSTGVINLSASLPDSYQVTYSVTGSGGCASVSTTQSVVINAAPKITTNLSTTPVEKSVGQSVTFTVAATGSGLTYQWYRGNDELISGATLSAYTISSVTTNDANTYYVVVSSVCGQPATSQRAPLSVRKLANLIAFTNPGTQTYASGATVALVATAPGGTVAFRVTSGPATVTGHILTLTGAGSVTVEATQAGNDTYMVADAASLSFNVNKAAATVTLRDLAHVYDRTPKAATATTSALGASSFTISYSQGDQSVSAPTLAGDYAVTANLNNDNYAGSASGVLRISAAPLTATIAIASKAYDGGTSAAVATTTLNGVFDGDVVTLKPTYSAEFTDRNVGTDKLVNVSGLALDGATASNYSILVTASAEGNITPVQLTPRIVAADKVYDRTTDVDLTEQSVLGMVAGETAVNLVVGAKSFNSARVGTRTVTASNLSLSGDNASNYVLANNATATAAAAITALTIDAVVTASGKTYDGNTNASISGRSLQGKLGEDAVALAGGAATFADKNAEPNKTVTVTDLSLTGDDAANYKLRSSDATAVASITERALTVQATVQDKPYDGTTNASVTLHDDRVDGDVLTVSFGAAEFNDKNVALSAKPVTVTGIAITGNDARNYTVNTSASTEARITAKGLIISLTATNKEYDGTRTAAVTAVLNENSGLVNGDVVTVNATDGLFDNRHVGTGKTVTANVSKSGADAGNYAANSTATTTANITAKELTALLAANNKEYNGSDLASATGSLPNGTISAGDVVSVTVTNARFSDKHVDTGKPVTATVELNGAQAGNYSLSSNQASATADITPKAMVLAISAIDKVYDGNDGATVTARISSGLVDGDQVTAAARNGKFDNKNVAANKPVTADMSISGADARNYSVNATTSTTASITSKALTISLAATNKEYDGTRTAAVTALLGDNNGLVHGDQVTVSASNGLFGTEHVGTGKTVTADVRKSGTDASNYAANSTATTTAAITAKTLTAVLKGNVSKVYDRSTAATLTADNYQLNGVVNSDAVALNNPTSGSYDTKTVGENKNVTVSGLQLTGPLAGNYSLPVTSISGSVGEITPRPLLVSATGQNKVYDGNTNATVTLSDNRVTNDVLSTSYTTATFADKNVANNTVVSVSGIAISGADAGNYLTNPTATTTANITAKELTASIAAQHKIYDGTDVATATGSLPAGTTSAGDVVTVTVTNARFANKNVGTGKAVTATVELSGAQASNYSLSSTQATTTANITKLSVTGAIVASNKEYDRTTAVTVASQLNGHISTDDVSLVVANASFDTKNVSTAKPVTADLSLSGADGDNYSVNATATSRANIWAKNLTPQFTASSKEYDGNASATILSRTILGVIAPDVVTLEGGSASFADKTVGTGKTVTGNGFALDGADATNYQLVAPLPTTTADITKKAMVLAISAIDKVYDRSDVATVTASISSGLVGGDDVTATASNGKFNDKTVGQNKRVDANVSISGTDAGNYAANPTATTTASITAKAITVAITASDKAYDGGTLATISTRTPQGVILGDQVTAIGGEASFTDRFVGTGKTVNAARIALSGNDAPNYAFDGTAATTAAITRKALTGSFTAANKVYNGANAATVTGRTLVGVESIDGNNVQLLGTATFADRFVGDDKTVTMAAPSLGGDQAGNYSISASAVATAKANITPKALTGSFTAANKVYDGTTAATVTGRTLVGVEAIDGTNVQLAGLATFNTPGAGLSKPVKIASPSLDGSLAYNYAISAVDVAGTTANITPALAVVTVTNAGTVQYSDVANFTVAVTTALPAVQQEINATGGSVTFLLSANNTVTTLGTVAVPTGHNSVLGSYKIMLAPNTYTVQAVFRPNSGNVSSVTNANAGSLEVKTEDADVVYSGLEYFGTASPDSRQANVEYIATLTDRNDNSRGDITSGRVQFTDGNAPAMLAANVAPIDSANFTVGSGRVRGRVITLSDVEWRSGGKTLELTAQAQGNYQNSISTLVTIAVPGQDNVTGGGSLVMTSSSGTLAATPNSRMNFGFTMKWNKSGRNIQGQANIIFRRLVDGVWRTYQIKSNAINTLGTLPVTGGRRADFNTKANCTDITNPLAPVSVAGNLDLSVSVFESTVSTQPHTIAVTLRNSNTVVFSSNWDGARTLPQALHGGKISVMTSTGITASRSANEPASAVATTAPETAAKPGTSASVAELRTLLEIYPNPMAEQANIHFRTQKGGKAQLYLYNEMGVLVATLYNAEVQGGQEYTVTLQRKDLTGGVYFCRLITNGKVENKRLVVPR